MEPQDSRPTPLPPTGNLTPGGAARPPPPPIPSNSVRPPPPRPANPNNPVMRPPMPGGGAVRPNMMRPPMPGENVRPNLMRPPPPSISRPPLPSSQVPINRPPAPQQVAMSRPPVYRPPMPQQGALNRPPMLPQGAINRPPIPSNPTILVNPNIPPMRPPIAQNIPQQENYIRPPLPTPPNNPNRAPMPSLASPVIKPPLAPTIPAGPAVPTMPTIPSVNATSPQMRTPMPVMRPPIMSPSAQTAPMRPPIPGANTVPSVGRPPVNHVLSGVQDNFHNVAPPMVSPRGAQIPQHPSLSVNNNVYGGIQPPNQPPQFPGAQQGQQYPDPYSQQPPQFSGHQSMSHSQSSGQFGSGQMAISASSHDLKEFHEELPQPFIQPNINPDYLTCSLGKIPRNASLLGKARTPFGITVSFYPYGDAEKDRVPEVSGAIVRCRRCRTYLNPFAELIEQDTRWRCNICFLANEFPPNYDFDPIRQANIERRAHPELNSFIYDFTNAPVEYTVRPPQPPVFLFALEVTAAAVETGLFASACRVIAEQLDAIPNEDGRARVALITFDQRIHFYQMSVEKPEARILVVADAGDPFLPAMTDLLVSVAECRSQLDNLLEQLPQLHATPARCSPALGPVLRCAHQLLRSVGGKIVLIAASLPTQFEGALRARDDAQLLGTAKESSALLQPASPFYKLLASEIVKDQIGIDLFMAPPGNSYIDLASISALAKYTGGKLNYYPGFGGQHEGVASKFCSDLRRFLGQPHGFEAVLRIRASQGISLSAYHGSFFLRQTDLLALPNVNPDHSFSAQASIEENLPGTRVCFQAALLHTSGRGERRIRVINFAAPVVDTVGELFGHMDVPGIAAILTKMAVEKVLANRLQDAREAVMNKCADVLAAYKSSLNSGNPSGGGIPGFKSSNSNPGAPLLVPQNLRNFPILLHALVKSIALRAGTTTPPDLRSHHFTLLKTLSTREILGLLLPRFYALHTLSPEVEDLPALLNLSAEKLERHGIFLLDNGIQQFLWIGSNCHAELLNLLFGISSVAQTPSGRVVQLLPEIENDWNRRVRSISNRLRLQFAKGIEPEYYVIKEDSEPALKSLFLANLIEDRSPDGAAPSYAQWLMEVGSRVNSSTY